MDPDLGGDHRLSKAERTAVHVHGIRLGETGVPEVNLHTCLFNRLNGIELNCSGSASGGPFHNRTKVRLGPTRRVETRMLLLGPHREQRERIG